MKKCIILVLLVACFLPAWAGKNAVIIEGIPEKQHVSSHKAIPNGELQLSVLYTATSPLHRAAKNMTDGSELFSNMSAVNSPGFISSRCIAGRYHAKGYLIHIFPSHYFW